MDSSRLKLGQTWWGDEKRERDAVHIAVAPVIAGEPLRPGQRVGFTADDRATVGAVADDKAVGIVDPYLNYPVSKGTRCWLFLLPGTVTGLRHQWTHPAFGDAIAVDAAKAWIAAFALEELSMGYDRLMGAAQRRESDDWEYDNTETYKNVDDAKWAVFWRHYQTITGIVHPEHAGAPFTCSC